MSKFSINSVTSQAILVLTETRDPLDRPDQCQGSGCQQSLTELRPRPRVTPSVISCHTFKYGIKKIYVGTYNRWFKSFGSSKIQFREKFISKIFSYIFSLLEICLGFYNRNEDISLYSVTSNTILNVKFVETWILHFLIKYEYFREEGLNLKWNKWNGIVFLCSEPPNNLKMENSFSCARLKTSARIQTTQ